jgi:tyrosyl-tRNA synthetase
MLMQIITDKNAVGELLARGVENIYPKKEFLESLLKSGRQLTLYTGYDPTAPTLHIGHGITMLKLRQFQDLGHKIIMLVGDFTGMIGDPTDKTSARRKLTRKQVLENCKSYKKQAAAILNFVGKNPVEVKFNSKWLAKLTLEDVAELASFITVQRMLERDMFQNRIKEEKPIYLHEFLYPLMQGYDSVAMDVDGEVGGNDQTFNMLVGRDLMKDLKNKEKFVLTTKLLTDSAGKKMGKTEGNMIALGDAPEDMFGKVMSWTDDMIIRGFELCTRVPMPEVSKMETEMKKGSNPRDYKLRLAYELVKIFLGEKAAQQGQKHFHKVIQEKEKPAEIPDLKPAEYTVIAALTESKICKSRSEARQVIAQGGVKINENKVEDIGAAVKKGDVVKKGNRFFVRIV